MPVRLPLSYTCDHGSNQTNSLTDFIILNAGAPSSDQDVRLAAVAVQQQQQQPHQQQQLGDYDAPNHKRPRISGGWGT